VTATVLILLAMGTAVALIATGTISIPWLVSEQPAPARTPLPPGQPAPEPSPAQMPGEVPAPAAGEPGPESPAATPPKPSTEAPPSSSPDLTADLLPLLSAIPFDEAALLARIEELRGQHPDKARQLDDWAAAAKARTEQLRLRRIP
jgi:hypothetical protein